MTETQTTTAVPALTVREMTASEVPPLPDPEKYRAYFDAEGRLPAPREVDAGHYQQLVLEVRTGRLYFFAQDWRIPRGLNGDRADRFPPVEGIWAPFHWLKVPDIIFWTIDSGIPVEERPYLTLEEGNQFAREVAPLAEALLLNLVAVPGTDTFDWSAESASAGLDIQAACSRHKTPPRGRRPELVNMAEAVSVHPRLVQDRWATMTDAQLDEEAEHLNRCGLDHNQQIAKGLGIDPRGHYASLVGTRAWLYEQRLMKAAGRPVQSVEKWLAATEAAAVERAHAELAQSGEPTGLADLYVTADTTDAELETSAERVVQDAEAEGIVLLGDAKRAATARRVQLRQQVLDELAMFGTARAEAEKVVKSSRSAIYSRLYQAFSWDGQPVPSDADLGRLAQMSRQAVNKLHEPLDADA
ncbi:hypothetical protein OOK58_59230 [Streptomyces sp. NBC_01728]|uniref:hypothetical protein n=1 Tax=unclassified Streptomyces TaxID=2593676 RepID=UPI002255B021|nr:MULTISPECIES: hypothetical protein [unclassified Streptomyces]MCX4462444.1 hypothetical protein [Streptomyces sp. NBC_01719]MCX4500874.1 hypothetical protein [Streptomyces sp. NBC_01728]